MIMMLLVGGKDVSLTAIKAVNLPASFARGWSDLGVAF
jgi:hypothetical protein